jgi:hypothetical protein
MKIVKSARAWIGIWAKYALRLKVNRITIERIMSEFRKMSLLLTSVS